MVDRVFMGAGLHQVVVDGSALPDGEYTVQVSARTAAGASVETEIPLAISRTLGTVSVAPAAFSPNGDGRLDRLTIDFTLANPADVRIRILRDDGAWVATPVVTESLPLGPQRFTWDGSRLGGGDIRDGSYEAVVDVTDAVGTVSFGIAVRVRHDRAGRPHPAREPVADRRQRAGGPHHADRRPSCAAGGEESGHRTDPELGAGETRAGRRLGRGREQERARSAGREQGFAQIRPVDSRP